MPCGVYLQLNDVILYFVLPNKEILLLLTYLNPTIDMD